MNSQEHPVLIMAREQFGEDLPPVFGMMNFTTPLLIICDPTYLKEIYVTKHKILDKDQLLAKSLDHIVGTTAVVRKGDEQWF